MTIVVETQRRERKRGGMATALGTTRMPSILIAEDEPSLREFLIRGLGIVGYRVASAADGSAALEALATSTFDLLITDIVMPKLDGIALALKASKDYPNMKILMMTGYAHERMRAHNLDCLSHDIIAKPFALDQIQAIVANVIGGGPAIP
jgi:two-component system cell cycle response regulator CpdR